MSLRFLRSPPLWRCSQRLNYGQRRLPQKKLSVQSSKSCSEQTRQVRSLKKKSSFKGQVLFLSFNWPEPQSSAAGVRSWCLIEGFQSRGFNITWASASSFKAHKHNRAQAKKSQKLFKEIVKDNDLFDKLRNSGIEVEHVPTNRGYELRSLLQRIQPAIVVFDRFMAEEAFGARVHEDCQNALRILDMQDMHSLRKFRQRTWMALRSDDEKQVRNGSVNFCRLPHCENDMHNVDNVGTSVTFMKKVMTSLPDATDINLLRELASIQRCDLALVCSPVEQLFLRDVYNISANKLAPAPFFCKDLPTFDENRCLSDDNDSNFPNMNGNDSNDDMEDAEVNVVSEHINPQKKYTFCIPKSPASKIVDYNERQGFVTVGTFKHAPNLDSVQWLADTIWPSIREVLPNATMHVYGAYVNSSIASHYHAPKNGFFLKGYVDDLECVLRSSRVLLSPLRFGAGLKGKIVDAWRCGLPVVTTLVGQEGMKASVGCTNINNVKRACRSPLTTKLPEKWGGIGNCETAEQVVEAAVILHEQYALWKEAQLHGHRLTAELYSWKTNMPPLLDDIENTMDTLAEKRKQDFEGQTLWHHTKRSTLYFSKWIELKEAGKNT